MQKNKLSIKEMATFSLVAALYVVMTLSVQSISYGVIQFRISEILNHVTLYHKKAWIALGVGVFIANLFSSAGYWDLLIGTATTIACCLISNVAFRYIKGELPRLLFNIFNFSVIGMVPIALMLDWLGYSEEILIVSYLTLVTSEIVVLSIGAVLFFIINKRFSLADFFNKN